MSSLVAIGTAVLSLLAPPPAVAAAQVVRPVDQSHAFAGPHDGYWESVDTVTSANLRWSACGKSHKLQIDTELQVEAGTADPNTTWNVMAMDSTDGVLATSTYDLTWKRC